MKKVETKPWTATERALLARLKKPFHIQCFVDDLVYHPEGGALSPRHVMRSGEAQCFSGAVFAAAALRRLGHRPRIIELVATNDDDHLLAVYQHGGFWGAVGKSNFTTLRQREPIYRSLRELALSYFDLYFNTVGQKTLRSYSVALDLARFDAERWQTAPGRLWSVEQAIEKVRHYKLLPPGMERRLEPVSAPLMRSSLLGSNPAGLFQPK